MSILLLGLACTGEPQTDGEPTTPTVPTAETAGDTGADTGTEDTGTAPVDPATVPLDGLCPTATDFGGFGVESDSLLTVASGAVADGVVPLTVLNEVGAAGDCALLRRNNPFCDPPCAPDQTCDHDGECIPYPVQQDVGTVTIDGLLAPVAMEPTSPGNSYYALGLPHPAVDPGELVTLRASGITLHGVGVEPLALADPDWVLEDGTDMVVTWNAPTGAVRSRVHLRVTIDQHGLTPVQLDCDFPDTGQGVVPGSLVSDLIAFGVTGFPNGSLTRSTADSTAFGEGCVDFRVAWSETVEPTVAGYVPCTEQSDCPKGQTCNTTLEICE